ncbi:hypothetical protein B0H11DRAFT_1918314 [Mycena galericulata]|nr:hypothetical protein B0H11DRAFT_1918314 [Mycena galericulata]
MCTCSRKMVWFDGTTTWSSTNLLSFSHFVARSPWAPALLRVSSPSTSRVHALDIVSAPSDSPKGASHIPPSPSKNVLIELKRETVENGAQVCQNLSKSVKTWESMIGFSRFPQFSIKPNWAQLFEKEDFPDVHFLAQQLTRIQRSMCPVSGVQGPTPKFTCMYALDYDAKIEVFYVWTVRLPANQFSFSNQNVPEVRIQIGLIGLGKIGHSQGFKLARNSHKLPRVSVPNKDRRI